MLPHASRIGRERTLKELPKFFQRTCYWECVKNTSFLTTVFNGILKADKWNLSSVGAFYFSLDFCGFLSGNMWLGVIVRSHL